MTTTQDELFNWRRVVQTPTSIDDYIDRIAIENGYLNHATKEQLFSPNHNRYKEQLFDKIEAYKDNAVLGARIDELKRNAHYSQPRKTDPLTICGIDMDRSLLEERIAELQAERTNLNQEGK